MRMLLVSLSGHTQSSVCEAVQTLMHGLQLANGTGQILLPAIGHLMVLGQRSPVDRSHDHSKAPLPQPLHLLEVHLVPIATQGR